MMPEDREIILNTVALVLCGCMILLMLFYLYMKYCLKIKTRTAENHRAEHHTESHHQNRHTVMATGADEHRAATNQAAVGPQPNGNRFEDLPSYETVCRKDRQRHIYGMIAQRFSINGSNDRPPPTYDESCQQPLQPVDVHLPTHSQAASSNLTRATRSLR